MAEVVRIQLRRGTASQWTTANTTLGEAEFGIETDTGKFKIGDGITAWNDIANYFEPLDLSSYLTSEDLATELQDYATSADLSDYLTTASASSDYQTKAAMSLYASLSGATFSGDVILNADPTTDLGAATKQYVDSVATGLQTKPAVKAASTVNLSGTYDNGTSGVGSTLNLGQLATLDIDGVTSWDQYDGILLKDQTNAAQNGRWVMYQIGNGTDTDWILRRCGLCDDPSEIPGAYMFVFDGNVNVGTGWVLVVEDSETFQVGIDPIEAYEFTSGVTYTAGDGISIAGNSIAVTSDVVRDSDLTNYVTTTSTSTLSNKTLLSPIENFADANNSIISLPTENMSVKSNPAAPVNVFPGTLVTTEGDHSITYMSSLGQDTYVNFYDLGLTPDQCVVTNTVIIPQNSTPRTVDRFSIRLVGGNYTEVPINWLDSVVPEPIADTVSVYTFSVIRNGPATSLNDYTVLGSMTTYGA